MTKKDYILIGMTVASTSASAHINLAQYQDILDSWCIVLREENSRFDERKFQKFATARFNYERGLVEFDDLHTTHNGHVVSR